MSLVLGGTLCDPIWQVTLSSCLTILYVSQGNGRSPSFAAFSWDKAPHATPNHAECEQVERGICPIAAVCTVVEIIRVPPALLLLCAKLHQYVLQFINDIIVVALIAQHPKHVRDCLLRF